MATSPKEVDTHVGLRTKFQTLMPSIFWMAGTIWIALEPLPMTPTRLFFRSRLASVSGGQIRSGDPDTPLIPCSRVDELSLVLLQALDLGPSNVIEASLGGDDYVGGIFDDLSRLEVLDCHIPGTCQFRGRASSDMMQPTISAGFHPRHMSELHGRP
jgi:hypothetical protein